MMKRILLNSLIALLVSVQVSAQNFEYSAFINPVDSSGFHKVVLNPFLLGLLNKGMYDLRIYDENNQEVPYLFSEEASSSTNATFREYEITEQHFRENEVSYLVFHNPEKKEVNNLSIVVQNTDVQKHARLSGSNDNKTWYVIKNNYLLHSMHSNSETSNLNILNFPLSNFEFFKLEIDDYWKLPIHILKVGYYDYELQKGRVTTFDIPFRWSKDTLNSSYYQLALSDSFYVEKLQFQMSGADYFNRYTQISIPETLIRKKKEIHHSRTLRSFELNSNSDNLVNIGGFSTDSLYVEIQNQDNQPLKMQHVTGSYLNKYVIADFNPSHTYTIKFGAKNAVKAHYDLESFSDKIPTDLKMITHLAPQKINRIQPATITEEPGLFDKEIVIWIIIGVVGLLLAFVSLKMVREMGEK
tara:strand:- start:24988 stop:26226 length:1239 start_codon:yes stop_codon:yes gene_type:complete